MRRVTLILILGLAGLPAISARAAESGLEIEFSIAKTEYLVCEPVILTVRWHNRTGSTVQITYENLWAGFDGRITQVGGPTRSFKVHRPVPMIGQGGVVPDVIPPGGQRVQQFVIVKLNLQDAARDGFLLPAPGDYTIYRKAQGRKKGVTVHVRAPQNKVDQAALRTWRAEGAQELSSTTKEIKALQKMRRNHGSSLYTQYARLGILEKLTSDSDVQREIIREILQADAPPPVIERTCWAGIPPSKRPEKIRLLARLAREYPDSVLLPDAMFSVGISSRTPERAMQVFAQLKALGVKPDSIKDVIQACGFDLEEVKKVTPLPLKEPKKPAAPPGPITLNLDERALKGLPAGAREAFMGYWKAICRRDVEAALAFLADDFVGDEGSKTNRAKFWRKHIKRSKITSVALGIARMEITDKYERARNLPMGSQRRWEGEIVTVSGYITTWEADGVRRSGDKTWALKKQPDGKWLFISERSEGSIMIPPGADVPADVAGRFERTATAPESRLPVWAWIAGAGGLLLGLALAAFIIRRRRRA